MVKSIDIEVFERVIKSLHADYAKCNRHHTVDSIDVYMDRAKEALKEELKQEKKREEQTKPDFIGFIKTFGQLEETDTLYIIEFSHDILCRTPKVNLDDNESVVFFWHRWSSSRHLDKIDKIDMGTSRCNHEYQDYFSNALDALHAMENYSKLYTAKIKQLDSDIIMLEKEIGE